MEVNSSEERQLVKVEGVRFEEMTLEQKQRAEQLYQQLGLNPIVDKVLGEFPKSLSGMDRFTDKVLGPYDIKGRADAVARVTALVTYAMLSEDYHKERAGLESHISTLEGERDDVRTNYDNLVQRVADVVGGDYDELKASYTQVVERLSGIEHLRAQVASLDEERKKLTEKYEVEIATLKSEHRDEVNSLGAQLSGRDSKIEELGKEKVALTSELRDLKEDYDGLKASHEKLAADYDELKTAAQALEGAIPYEEIKKKLKADLYSFLLKDSKVPDAVIDGVGKFIDFKKYLGMAVEKGAQEASRKAEEALSKVFRAAE